MAGDGTAPIQAEPNLDSFVLRFVRGTDAPAWHGMIRHVQSNTERHFTRWDDALTFISGFVDLREDERDA